MLLAGVEEAMMLSSYPSIYALGHRYVKDIFTLPVVIQEKVDGSQISFGVNDAGELHIRSKGALIHAEAPEKMFAAGVDAIKTVKYLLKSGYVYRGEYLKGLRQNILTYNRIPANHIILYDIEVGLQDFLTPQFLKQEAFRLGFEAVPVLFQGQWPVENGVEGFKKLLELDSVLGGPKIEGVVIKNYALMGPDKRTLMAKFVSEDFKETHAKVWKNQHPGKGDILALMIAAYRTEARWHKAVQHLRDSGLIEDAPKDIGLLIREVPLDVEKECAEEIKEKLYAHFWPQIRRGLTAGVVEWYKSELLKRQFGERGEVAEEGSGNDSGGSPAP